MTKKSRTRTLSVGALAGVMAVTGQREIVDQNTTGWGHINVEDRKSVV